MAKKIHVRRFGSVHYAASCCSCGFNAGIQTAETPTAEDVRREVRNHVRETGHTVSIENGMYTTYQLEEDWRKELAKNERQSEHAAP